MQVLAVVVEVKDQVTDELSGAVVGGLAAATDFDEWVWEFGWVAQAGLIASAADGVNGIVFQEEDGVFDFARAAFRDELELQLECLIVGESIEFLDCDHF